MGGGISNAGIRFDSLWEAALTAGLGWVDHLAEGRGGQALAAAAAGGVLARSLVAGAVSQPGWIRRFAHSNPAASLSFKKVSSSLKNGSTCHPPKATAVQHLVQPTKGRQDPGRKARRSPHQEACCKCPIDASAFERDQTRDPEGGTDVDVGWLDKGLAGDLARVRCTCRREATAVIRSNGRMSKDIRGGHNGGLE
jgi:hypothetical protein